MNEGRGLSIEEYNQEKYDTKSLYHMTQEELNNLFDQDKLWQTTKYMSYPNQFKKPDWFDQLKSWLF